MVQKNKLTSTKTATSSRKKQLDIKPPQAINEEQKEVFQSMKDNTVTFITGPAGCGKTFISVSQALYDYSKNKYKKIILTRPAVEAHGEKLGFLPGDACDKLAPYMMPVMDVLGDHLEENFINTMVKKNEIITIPLAFQRGLTFKDAFVVFDEAQNTTRDQMRMFLTRIGENCKVVVSGDLRQKDRMGGINGLQHAISILDGVKNIGIVNLTEKSIVRSEIVADIESRYNEEEKL